MAEYRKDVWAGVFLALGAFKPQLALLIGIWFLLDRRILLLVVAAAVTALLSIWPLVVNGIEGSWLGWLTSVSDYQVGQYSQVGFKHVFGLRSLFYEMGLEIPSLSILALIALIALYYFRSAYETVWLVGLIFAISALLFYAHDYDLAVIAVMSYPLLHATRGKLAMRLVLVFLTLVLVFPQRIWGSLGFEEFARSREVALTLLVCSYLVLCRRPKVAPQAAFNI